MSHRSTLLHCVLGIVSSLMFRLVDFTDDLFIYEKQKFSYNACDNENEFVCSLRLKRTANIINFNSHVKMLQSHLHLKMVTQVKTRQIAESSYHKMIECSST